MNLKRKFRLRGWMMLIAAVLMTGIGGIRTQRASAASSNLVAAASSAQSAVTNTCASTSLTIENQNSFPIWLGEEVQVDSTGAANILMPPNNDWEMQANTSMTMCVPPNWSSGIFFARTECDFSGTFGQDPNYTACTSKSQCASDHICYGGRCVTDCSSTGTNGDCSTLPNSQCVTPINGNPLAFCGFANGVCKTGDCGNGMYQCEGTWDGVTSQQSPQDPITLFEITTGTNSANYDVSNVSGNNMPVGVSFDFTPGSNAGATCSPTACNGDLRASCPSLLQVIEPPTGTGGSCGGATCQTGVCESCPSGAAPGSCVNGETCVIGCDAPSKLCPGIGSVKPFMSGVDAPGMQSLDCYQPVPGDFAGFTFTSDGSWFEDMYNVHNQSGAVYTTDNAIYQVSMFSSNQGTPTCWGDLDCPPNQNCLLGPTATGIANLPPDLGICADTSASPPIPNGSVNCASTADIDQHCGGYSTSPVYTCVAAPSVSTGVACLPAFDPPTVGIGTLDTMTQLFTGIGGPPNPEWMAASLWASGDGTNAGTIPYYETFAKVCPHQYAWQYDDQAGGLACTGFPLAYTVAFGGASPSATPTATPTATATSSATATPTASATPTPTGTATATSTATATRTATATPTATATTAPTATATVAPTATATATRTATPTATATTAPTPTATPSSSATPICSPDVFLSTSPAGTLAFGNVAVGASVTLPVTVTNNEPAGTLKLHAEILRPRNHSFAITGGTCQAGTLLSTGGSCTYEITLTGLKPHKGDALSVPFFIRGHFENHVCPGHIQSATVDLSTFVNQ
ncbi:MAG: thaumatin family protein [Candidatus Binataceae bacterium]